MINLVTLLRGAGGLSLEYQNSYHKKFLTKVIKNRKMIKKCFYQKCQKCLHY